MSWDDFERVLAYMVFVASWSAPMHSFDERERLQLQNEYLERWPL